MAGEAAAAAPAVAAALRRAAAAAERGVRGEAVAAAREAPTTASRPEDRGQAHGRLALALVLDDPDDPAGPDEEAEAHQRAALAFTAGAPRGPELTDALLALLHDLTAPAARTSSPPSDV